MTLGQQLAAIWIIIPLITVVILVVKLPKVRAKKSGTRELLKKKKMHNRYVYYTTNVFVRKRFRQIVMRYSSLACYSLDQVKEESVRTFERAMIASLALPVVAAVLTRSLPITLLVCLVAYMYYELTVDKRIDKTYKLMMIEISATIQSICDFYKETSNVATAVLRCDKGKYLASPLAVIYEILTDIDGEERLNDFCRSAPIRMLKTLATICFIVQEKGDEVSAEGESAFVSELVSLMLEVNSEVRLLEKTRVALSSLPIVALLGIATQPLIDLFLITKLPGTSTLVKGMYGNVEKTIVIVITLVAYYVISILSKHSVVNQVDKIEWIGNIAKRKKVRAWLANIIPKKYKTRHKIEVLMKSSLSSKDLNYVYLSKAIYAVSLWLVTVLILILFVITARSSLLNNYKSLSVMPDGKGMQASLYSRIVAVDKEYMGAKKKLSEEETYILVRSRTVGLTKLGVQKQCERLSQKWDLYHALTFKWYYILAAYVVGFVGWKLPEISLMLRKKMVKYEVEEDVLQLQSIMIVLSNTKVDVFEALYWLEKQSVVHKAILRYAYHAFTSEPEEALTRLAANSSSLDFKKLVSGLKRSVYSLSIHDAFSTVSINKTQMLSIREILQLETLESKKQWAKLIASAPVAVVLIGGFVLPILVLGFTSVMSVFTSMSPAM